jgi:hypothetical protein
VLIKIIQIAWHGVHNWNPGTWEAEARGPQLTPAWATEQDPVSKRKNMYNKHPQG